MEDECVIVPLRRMLEKSKGPKFIYYQGANKQTQEFKK